MKTAERHFGGLEGTVGVRFAGAWPPFDANAALIFSWMSLSPGLKTATLSGHTGGFGSVADPVAAVRMTQKTVVEVEDDRMADSYFCFHSIHKIKKINQPTTCNFRCPVKTCVELL